MRLEDKQLRMTPKRIEALHAMGIFDTHQLLSWYPFRYDTLNAVPIAQWKPKDKVTVQAEVISAVRSFHFGRNRTVSNFDVMCEDTVLHVSMFNRPWAKSLALNQVLTISGIYQGKDKLTAITYNTRPLSEQEAVTPVYSVKAGIQQRTIRDCIKRVLELQYSSIDDLLPASYVKEYRLLHYRDALRMIHMPKTMEEVKASYRTLKYQEFLEFFLSVMMMRAESQQGIGKTPRKFDQHKIDELISSLPFEMTPDQLTALDDILNDMRSTKIMYRLVQGDVGCGKTLVAACALYACVLAGDQGALLAPTEILARQHYASLTELLSNHGVKIGLLYSGMSSEETDAVLSGCLDGSIDILVGTHSILQDRVKFHKLGLVTADEQQRFGVEQRRALREKGKRVDFLLMSATPIPRTLASTLYGDMDISTIETMPKGRKPVHTVLIKENSFRSVLPEVRSLLDQGHQLYVICAAVEESEDYDARNAEKTAESLQKLFAPQYRVGLLHGRMSSQEKQDVMNEFADNKIQVLVSTTVVEVGMNVVNATGMIVYDADRFGMSQLHQLRGRIQRGSCQGECWLLTDSEDEKALKRLDILTKSANGFEISYEDLRLRGPGDILGTRQSGASDFILGNLVEDTRIINQARKDAETVMAHPETSEYQAILQAVRLLNEHNASYAD